MCPSIWRRLSGGEGPDFSDAAFRAIVRVEYGLDVDELAAPAEPRPAFRQWRAGPWLLVATGGSLLLLAAGLWLLGRML